MNLGDLNNWLNYKPYYPLKNTIYEYIHRSFKRYINLLDRLEFDIIDKDNFEKRYILFLSMYSLKKFKIKKHKQFHHDKDVRIFDTFGTYYGNTLIEFIENEKQEFRNTGLDILQKKNCSLFLEFIVFTMKHIELDNVYLLQ